MTSVDVSRSSNEYVMASLAKAVDKTEVNRRAVEAWMEKASGESARDRRSPRGDWRADLLPRQLATCLLHALPSMIPDRRSTLVFCVSIAHIVSLTNAFREQGIDARFVHEGIKVYERERLYEQFKRGEFPVLINCGEFFDE
jgi:superfamily II DNA or RNA helicase